MPTDEKVSALTETTVVTDADEMYIVDGSSSRRVSVANVHSTLPSLEASEDTPQRLGAWDDSVSGVIRPVPSREIMVRERVPVAALVANTTTETSFFATARSIAADEWEVGTLVSINLYGTFKNDTAKGANTAIIRVTLGGTSLFEATFTVPQASSTAGKFTWQIESTALFIDFIGTRVQGGWVGRLSQEDSQTNEETLSGELLGTNTFDLTTANDLDVTVEHSIADADTTAGISAASHFIVTEETAP